MPATSSCFVQYASPDCRIDGRARVGAAKARWRTHMTSLIAGQAGLITGAGSGIGAAIAELLARDGGRLALMDQRPEGVTAVTESIRANGGEASEFIGDVRDYAAMEAAVAATIAR